MILVSLIEISTQVVFDDHSKLPTNTTCLGFLVAEDVGAQILYKAKSNTNSNYKTLQGGNPVVVMNNNAINRDSDIVVINLPDRSTNFETIDPVESPNFMNVPASGTIRLKVDISNNANSGCDKIPYNGNYEKVLGEKKKDNKYTEIEFSDVLKNFVNFIL